MVVPKLTLEKSQELAHHIEMMKLYIQVIDLDYAKLLSEQMIAQAGRQDSISVLNPSYDFKQSELLIKQGTALLYLVKYVETLKECDVIKQQINKNKYRKEEINKLFV